MRKPHGYVPRGTIHFCREDVDRAVDLHRLAALESPAARVGAGPACCVAADCWRDAKRIVAIPAVQILKLHWRQRRHRRWWRDRFGRAADDASCCLLVLPPRCRSFKKAASAGLTVASRLGIRAAVLVGPERAVRVRLAHSAAVRRAVSQLEAVVWRAREEVTRSILKRDWSIGVVDVAASWHGPRRWW